MGTASMKLFALIVLACIVREAQSQSVKSCGGASDHLKNAVFSVSPDPIDKSKPLTITATGNLDEAMTAGKFDVNLQIKALGIVNEPVSTSAPFTLAPGIPTGAQKFVIGPFTLPKIPGSVSVSGNVTAVDGKGEPVFCLALDLNLGSSEENIPSSLLPFLEYPALPEASPVSDCSADSDHLHNRSLTQAGGVTTVSGDLDEDVSAGTVNVDLNVQVLFIKIPINMNIPFSLSPGLLKGAIKATVGPAGSSLLVAPIDQPEIKVKVTGTVKANDDKSSEIVCLKIDQE